MRAVWDSVAAAFDSSAYSAGLVRRLRASMEQLQEVPATSASVRAVVDELFEEVLQVQCP